MRSFIKTFLSNEDEETVSANLSFLHHFVLVEMLFKKLSSAAVDESAGSPRSSLSFE
jgi:hypothetical protein